MATDYISLLNLTYEIEGLILLHINRGEEASPEMTTLLEDKIGRLASFLPNNSSVISQNTHQASVSVTSPDQEAIAKSVVEEETDDACQNNPTPDQEAIANAVIEEETEDAYQVKPAEEQPADKAPAQPQSPAQPLSPTQPKVSPQVTTQPRVQVQSQPLAQPQVSSQPQDSIQPKDDTLRLEDKLARERARDIFKAFTINDKFRFRRELFRNSQDEFDDTLYVIAQMTDFVEAEEYFYNDLCWNPENEDVKEFMEIVKKHF